MVNRKNILATADAIENLIFPTLGWNNYEFYYGPDLFYGPRGEEGGVIGRHFIRKDYSGRNMGKVADVMGWAYSVMIGEELDHRAILGGYLQIFKLKRQQSQFFGIDPIQYTHIALMQNHPMHKTAYDSLWVYDVPRLHIVKVLRRLAKTGEVDWN